MLNNYYSTYPCINIYEKPSVKSKISSQIIYGENFKVLRKVKNFFEIRTFYDRYHGYIKKKKFINKIKPTHKVKVLKTKIYKSNNFLPFSSKIEILKRKNNYVMFKKNKWIKQKDITSINKKEKNFLKIIKSYLNCKYKWGGKTYKGIDCSALVQIFYKFNNKFFPRDTIDQIKYKNGSIIKKKFKSGDIIYWKGHVAVCINSKKLIHAYGPKKKVVIMSINETIKRIEKTANLKVKKICRI
ncbi:C40 family peptidase [Candidatus Pelagibacter sp.]|nr:C40 family peptidase [Candidatus Pelagibacter sp.]